MNSLTVAVTLDKDDGVWHLTKNYLRGIQKTGAKPLLLYPGAANQKLDELLDVCDGVLFTGGADVEPSYYGAARQPVCGTSHPSRDRMEIDLFKKCLKRRLPIFAICRGCQIINVACGGTLIQDIPHRYHTIHQMTRAHRTDFLHMVHVLPDTHLFEMYQGDVWVDSYHHQCVDRLGDGLKVSARAPEGFVEAFESENADQYLVAVQWHPEVTLRTDVFSEKLFLDFSRAMWRYHSSVSSRI